MLFYERLFMNPRNDKDLEVIVKTAVNLAYNVSYASAENLMLDAGVSLNTIERILYDPNNVRKTDLNNKDLTS